jgi:hypothetical protein
LPRRPARQKPKLIEFHIMRIGATPARLVGVVRATDKHAALAEVIECRKDLPSGKPRPTAAGGGA